MIERHSDPWRVNQIANTPDVRAMIFTGLQYSESPLDFTNAVTDPRNFALEEDGFCAIFAFSAPGVYECHIMGEKASRGAGAMQSGHRMLDYMKDHGATMVWGQPSIYNRAAICYIRRMGLKSKGLGQNPDIGEVEYFVKEDL